MATDCPHADIRYFPEEEGAIACMDCGRCFGHLVDGWMNPHNVITIDESILRAVEERIANGN